MEEEREEVAEINLVPARAAINCVCPNCGHKVPHAAGQRCIDMNCPECGTKMIRE